jgi:hypothetical protein
VAAVARPNELDRLALVLLVAVQIVGGVRRSNHVPPVLNKAGAGDGLRTRYLDLGKVALYQVSYSRSVRGKMITPEGRVPPHSLSPRSPSMPHPGSRPRLRLTFAAWKVGSGTWSSKLARRGGTVWSGLAHLSAS